MPKVERERRRHFRHDSLALRESTIIYGFRLRSRPFFYSVPMLQLSCQEVPHASSLCSSRWRRPRGPPSRQHSVTDLFKANTSRSTSGPIVLPNHAVL